MKGDHLRKIEARQDHALTVLFPEHYNDDGRHAAGQLVVSPDNRLARIIQRLTRQGRTVKTIEEDVRRVHRLIRADVTGLIEEVQILQSPEYRQRRERQRDAKAAAGDYWWMNHQKAPDGATNGEGDDR